MSKVRRFANAGTTTLPLADNGEWIKVKTRLSTGDQKRLENAGIKPVIMDGRIYQVVDWATHDIERAYIFIVDWNLSDDNNKNVPFSLDALKNLDPDSFEEINKAVLAHVMEQAKLKKQEREEKENQKKTADMPPAAEPIAEPPSQ